MSLIRFKQAGGTVSLKGKERASGPGRGLQHKVDPLFGLDIGPLDGNFLQI